MSKEKSGVKPQKLQAAENEVVDYAATQRLKAEEELDALYDELEKGGYLDKAYAKDSKVTIDGTLFSSFVNLLTTTRQSLSALQNIGNVLIGTVDAMHTDQALMVVSVMKAHMQNTDDGNTISKEEVNKQDAKQNIKPVASKKKKKK